MDDAHKIIRASVDIPQSFNIHPRLSKVFVEGRLKGFLENKVLDWAAAEALAFGSLLTDGHHIRLVGQDVARGTFSQRHMILYDQQTGEPLIPLGGDYRLEIVNSPLSELAVLGFEYGQSLVDANKLCIWEAQFGDFFNGAQAIMDTFIVSGEQKWGLQTGLVLLLPHGYNGAGPEHSSCRLERFLQSSDEPVNLDKGGMGVNIQVTQPTTAANYFHLLRRQMKRNFRKPLIVASAKQLLRLPAALSPVSEFTSGQFRPIIYNPSKVSSSTPILTSGEIAYELEKEFPDALIIRIEQICPFPRAEICELFAQLKPDSVIFCQPEPENMGPYKYIKERLQLLCDAPIHFAGRRASAAPATGYSKVHNDEQKAIMDTVKGLISSK